MAIDVDAALTHLARHDSGRVLAMLARRFGDLDVADDAVQDAMIEAKRSWPERGVPDNPAAWLHVVARRKALDRLRRDASARRRLEAAGHELADVIDPGIEDDDLDPGVLDDRRGADLGDERLRLMLLCCHPAVGVDAQVALTLRLVGGLTTEEIAAAFLVPTSTLAQRISRAKTKIRQAAIPMSMPDALDDRLGAVLSVLYLTFNEGYLSRSAGDVRRVDLCEEAIRLADVVRTLAPEHGEPAGLLALMSFIHARRGARFDGDHLVLLDGQDRSLWQLGEIATANRVLAGAMRLMQPGPFQLEALIASHHANARTAADTDWARIVALYDQLSALRPSPVVSLNRSVAVAMADGPLAGLRALDSIDQLDHYHLFHAARGELLVRVGDIAQARESFRRARQLTDNDAERDHLDRCIERHTLG